MPSLYLVPCFKQNSKLVDSREPCQKQCKVGTVRVEASDNIDDDLGVLSIFCTAAIRQMDQLCCSDGERALFQSCHGCCLHIAAASAAVTRSAATPCQCRFVIIAILVSSRHLFARSVSTRRRARMHLLEHGQFGEMLLAQRTQRARALVTATGSSPFTCKAVGISTSWDPGRHIDVAQSEGNKARWMPTKPHARWED